MLQKFLRFLTAQQLAGVAVNKRVKVRGHDHRRLHHRVPLADGHLAAAQINPSGWHAKRRIANLQARHGVDTLGGNGQQPVGQTLAAPHLATINQEAIRFGRQLQIVSNVHRRREKTHVGNELAPDGPNALNQIAVFTFVHHGNEAIGQLQAQGLHHRHIGPAQLLPASFIRVLRCRAAFNVGRLAPDHVSQARKQNRKHQKRAVRHARQYTQHRQDPRGNEQRTLIGVHLLGQLLRKIVFRGHARDQNTCRSRNNERRHLRYQTIANGERAVNRERFAKTQVVIQYARDQTANQVDHQN